MGFRCNRWPGSSRLLPTTHQSICILSSDVGLAKWSEGHNCIPPIGAGAMKEKNYNAIRAGTTVFTLLKFTSDEVEQPDS